MTVLAIIHDISVFVEKWTSVSEISVLKALPVIGGQNKQSIFQLIPFSQLLYEFFKLPVTEFNKLIISGGIDR